MMPALLKMPSPHIITETNEDDLTQLTALVQHLVGKTQQRTGRRPNRDKLTSLLANALISKDEVMFLTGLSMSTIDRKEKPYLKNGDPNPCYDPTWPRRIRLGPGPTSPVRWPLERVVAWIKAREPKPFEQGPKIVANPLKPKINKIKFRQTDY